MGLEMDRMTKRFEHYLGELVPFIKDTTTGKRYPFLSLSNEDIVTLTKLLNEVEE